MQLTFTVVWKSWVSNPLRTGLTILGIAFGVAIVVAIHTMDHNTVIAHSVDTSDRGSVDLEILVTNPTEVDRVRQDLLERAGVSAVGAWQQVPRLGLEVGDERLDVRLYGLAPLGDPVFSRYRVRDGQDLADPAANEVLIGRTLAQNLGVAPGDDVVLGTAGTNRVLVCRGGKSEWIEIASPTLEPQRVRVVGVLEYAIVGRENRGEILIAPLALARSLFPAGGVTFQVLRERGADLDRLRQELIADEYPVENRRAAMIGERADERAFRNGVKILGGLALVVGMFLVFQTLSQSLVERLRQLGLLRCLGASRRAVMGIFLVDASAMGVLGAVSGVGLGLALAALLKAYKVSSLGMGKEWVGFEIPLTPILWTSGMALVFTLAGASFPLWRARNVPALAILHSHGVEPRGGRGWALHGVNTFLFVLLVLFLPAAYFAMTPLVSEEGRETLVVLAQIGGLIVVFGGVLLLSPRLVSTVGAMALLLVRRWLPLSGFLVLKNVRRNPGRIAASICGLAIVLVALLGLESITHALHGDVRRFSVEALEDRVFVELNETQLLTADEVASLADLPGVRAVHALEGRAERPLRVAGLDVMALAAGAGALAGQLDKQGEYEAQRCLVVSRRLARIQDLAVGDSVTLQNGREQHSYRVLAISDAVGFVPDETDWAVAAPRWIRQDFCLPERSVGHICLLVESGTSHMVLGDRIRERFPGRVSKVKHGEGERDYMLRDVQRDFLLFHFLLALILGMAALGLVNSMTLAAVGRAREIGVMRALGLSRGSLRAIFLVEGMLVGLIAAFLALALGVPLGMLIVDGLNEVAGLDAPYVVPWNWFFAIPGIGLGAGLLAAILPGLRACRQTPAEAVRYE